MSYRTVPLALAQWYSPRCYAPVQANWRKLYMLALPELLRSLERHSTEVRQRRQPWMSSKSEFTTLASSSRTPPPQPSSILLILLCDAPSTIRISLSYTKVRICPWLRGLRLPYITSCHNVAAQQRIRPRSTCSVPLCISAMGRRGRTSLSPSANDWTPGSWAAPGSRKISHFYPDGPTSAHLSSDRCFPYNNLARGSRDPCLVCAHL